MTDKQSERMFRAAELVRDAYNADDGGRAWRALTGPELAAGLWGLLRAASKHASQCSAEGPCQLCGAGAGAARVILAADGSALPPAVD